MIDPNAPTPLYQQIAEAIRDRILRGELAPGETLQPLRDAALSWHVNLHTVRHAYTALAREGLVETRGTRGTRVTVGRTTTTSSSAHETFVRSVLRGATKEGLSLDDLIRLLQDHVDEEDEDPVVYVVECSRSQCESHAAELHHRFGVDAREWSLERRGEPPENALVVSTYFHYNDIRRRWPHRLQTVRFVAIGPAPDLADELSRAGIERASVCERDPETAATVLADLTPVLGRGVRLDRTLIDDVDTALRTLADDAAVLFPPRVWAEVSERQREHPRTFEARYVLRPEAVEELTAVFTPRRS